MKRIESNTSIKLCEPARGRCPHRLRNVNPEADATSASPMWSHHGPPASGLDFDAQPPGIAQGAGSSKPADAHPSQEAVETPSSIVRSFIPCKTEKATGGHSEASEAWQE